MLFVSPCNPRVDPAEEFNSPVEQLLYQNIQQQQQKNVRNNNIKRAGEPHPIQTPLAQIHFHLMKYNGKNTRQHTHTNASIISFSAIHYTPTALHTSAAHTNKRPEISYIRGIYVSSSAKHQHTHSLLSMVCHIVEDTDNLCIPNRPNDKLILFLMHV